MASNIPPPPPPAPIVPRAAYVEDCNEDDQAGRPETRQSANISSKRSKPDVVTAKAGRDETSDSGYSSHTVATLGSSAPSSLESKAGSNPPKVQDNTVAIKRKPKGVENIIKARSHSPEKPSLRSTQSKAKKENVENKPKANGKPLLGGLLRSKKLSPAQIVQDVPKAPPARPRASTSQSDHRARPVSFHAGTPPVFVQQPIILERQPSYPAPSVFPPPSYPPLQQSYFPPPQLIPSPQDYYAPPLPPVVPRPRPSSRQYSHGIQSAPRPQSMYSQPMVQYGEEPIYTTIAPGVRPSHKTLPHSRSHASPEEHPARPEDYYKMLPPPPPPKLTMKPELEQRPPMIRNAHTTSDAHLPNRSRRSGHDESVKANVSNRSPTKQSFAEHERSRRPTPESAKRRDESVPNTHGIERSTSRMSTESKSRRQSRRASVYGHESLHDLEGQIEQYQASHRRPAANNAIPVEALVRKKKHPGSSSDTSSRHSGKSGKSRGSREGSDVKSRNDSDGLAMRFNASQGVNVQLKGNMEGRTISMKQSKDGEGAMEIAIGSRGRTVGSRPQAPSTDRSRRSSRSYSYTDGQGVMEVERHKTSSRPSREYSYYPGSGTTPLERVRTQASATESIKEEREPVVIKEKITTRSRSRRSSRSGYSGWGRAG